MDDPITDIHEVVLNLCTGSPEVQQKTLEAYFIPNASFYHPFCCVKNNRQAILRIFQWYKILSPHISIHINSVAYDETTLQLYVNISQTFAIWFIPFHRSPVTLTTLLTLVRGQSLNLDTPRITHQGQKYYISSQNDLYQVSEFVKFFAPWGIGTTVVGIWHWVATVVCILGAVLLGPLQPVFEVLSRGLNGGRLGGDGDDGGEPRGYGRVERLTDGVSDGWREEHHEGLRARRGKPLVDGHGDEERSNGRWVNT